MYQCDVTVLTNTHVHFYWIYVHCINKETTEVSQWCVAIFLCSCFPPLQFFGLRLLTINISFHLAIYLVPHSFTGATPSENPPVYAQICTKTKPDTEAQTTDWHWEEQSHQDEPYQ